jgi:hypothetical protein
MPMPSHRSTDKLKPQPFEAGSDILYRHVFARFALKN